MLAEGAAAVLDVPAVVERLRTVERRGRLVLPGGMAGSLDPAFAALIGWIGGQMEDAALLGLPT